MKLIKIKCKDADRNAIEAMNILSRVQKQYRGTNYERQANVLEEMLTVSGSSSANILSKARELEKKAKAGK